MSSDRESKTDPSVVLPLLRVAVGELHERVLVVGDPARAEVAAALLDDSAEIGSNREYVTYRGRYHDVPVCVVSHGVGAPGAGVCFEELCRAGVRRIIRAGTAGGLQDDVQDGSLVVATGAVRDDGLTPRIVPLGYPAVPSVDVVMHLRSAATGSTTEVHEGIVLTSALFYPHLVLGNDLQLWQRSGAIAVEMECAALFVIASLRGVEAGAILAIDGNPLTQQDDDMTGYDPYRAVAKQAAEAAVGVALEALIAGF